MGYYQLTESYSYLYNNRNLEEKINFYDNLRFIDELDSHEIESVMESALWELMDYGNTLDEAYDVIYNVFSQPLIEEIILDIQESYLAEGPVSRGAEWVGKKLVSASSNLAKRESQVKGRLQSAVRAIKNAPSNVKKNVSSFGTDMKKRAGAALSSFIRRGAKAATAAPAARTQPTRMAPAPAVRSAISTNSRPSGVNLPMRSTQASTRLPSILNRPAPAARPSRPEAKLPVPPITSERPGAIVPPITSERPHRTTNASRSTTPAARPEAKRMVPPAIPPITADSLRFHAQGQANIPRLPAAGGTSGSRSSSAPRTIGDTRRMQREIRAQQKQQEAESKYSARRRGRTSRKASAAASGSNLRGSVGNMRALNPVGAGSRTASGGLRSEQKRRAAIERAAGGGASATQSLRAYYKARNAANVTSEQFDCIISMITEDLVQNGYANSYESAAIILENLSEDSFYNLVEQYIY